MQQTRTIGSKIYAPSGLKSLRRSGAARKVLSPATGLRVVSVATAQLRPGSSAIRAG